MQSIWWYICNFAQTNPQTKNCKRATKPTHNDMQQCTTGKHDRKKQSPITAPTRTWRFSG